jgi:succinate dehydrogenase / fumarate reductase flavoprotein subunit
MWNKVGMGRNEQGLKEAIKEIPIYAMSFGKSVKVVGVDKDINQNLSEPDD